MNNPLHPTNMIAVPEHASRVYNHESANDIARLAIPELEKKIRDEFGYQVNLGFELECELTPSPEYIKAARNAGLDWSNPFYLPGQEVKSTGVTVSEKRPELYKSSLFPGSPYICYTYLELGLSKGKSLSAEIVFSHEASDASRPSGKVFSICRAVEAAKSLLVKTVADNQKQPFGLPTMEDLQSVSRQDSPEQSRIILKNLAGVSFASSIAHDDDFRTQGLHVNMSLKSLRERNLLSEEEDQLILKKMRDACAEMQLVLVGSENGYRRFTHEFSVPERFVNMQDNRKRWHSKAAGADADPYIAAMINLAGIYAGLCEIKKVRSFTSDPKYFRATTDPEDAKENFEHASMVFEVLDMLEPNLGKKFKSSVLSPQKATQLDIPART